MNTMLAIAIATQSLVASFDVVPTHSADGIALAATEDGSAVYTPRVSVVQPTGLTEVVYPEMARDKEDFTRVGGTSPGLKISEVWKRVAPGHWSQEIRVKATTDTRYYLQISMDGVVPGAFHSFEAEETVVKRYSLGFAGAGFEDTSLQTFPMGGVLVGATFYGMTGDSPGLWENRCWLDFNPETRRIDLANGDGSAKQVRMIPHEVDATSVYRAHLDGWQHIEMGEEQIFKTWHFASPAQNHYDVQLSAHLALANALGFNGDILEAILRNTSYLLLRRNLFRPESDYIFVSGVGYGWKQWVSDGFWMSRGLDWPQYDAEANNAVFFERVDYEDNAQYYLIWSYLVSQAGGTPDKRTVARAYHFIREHEHDGLFYPPRLTPEKKNMRTYHDQLEYEDDDPPASNQGFHCGALLAARELGFPVSEDDIERAAEGYRRMFNDEGGYFATSLKQRDHIGQDALYGGVLTYAVFGRKLLPDDMVKKHMETTMKLQSPYGMRVISKANGELLDGHSGVYVYGGSWFLNDGANYLAALIHGMDPEWVDKQLLWRLERELAWMPAFHESISTVTGKPHGHHLYSWNSGFWWLRREVRRQLGLTGGDPLGKNLGQRLGVSRQGNQLVLTPGPADLQRQAH